MSSWIPDLSARRLVTGLCFAGTGSLIAVSPLGRLSGGHINPAVSLAFWMSGKMRLPDFVAYVAAQMLGGMAGAVLLATAWRGHSASVQNGMTLPGAGWPLGTVFAWEAALTGTMVFMIFFFVSSNRLMRWTPLMNWLLIATMVWLEAPISGTSLNPARSFGPALVTGVWTDQWLYAVAPPVGAAGGLGLFLLVTSEARRILTGKLFSAPNYRTLFRPTAVRPGQEPVPAKAGCGAAPPTPLHVLPVAT